jgi:hypothetical protein
LAAPKAEVILFADEEGAAETARELGIRHVAEVARVGEGVFENAGFVSTNPGRKVVRSFFDAAQRMARHELVCYANCDIVLSRDFLHAVNAADALHGRFLMVGRRWDLDVEMPLAFGARLWERRWWILLKRSWRCTRIHDYGYHPAGKAGVWTDALSRRNYELAGGRWHLRTIDDATHLLGPSGLQAHPARRKRAAARFIRTARDAAWITALEWTRPLRRTVGLGKSCK